LWLQASYKVRESFTLDFVATTRRQCERQASPKHPIDKGDLNVTPRKRYTAGEIRFRTAAQDQKRIDWLLENHPDVPPTISSLLRILILREYERLQPKVTSH
jgi:hypothetical protein